MTYEEYAARGHRYSDYLKLSQWQRWRGLYRLIRRGVLPAMPSIVWVWQWEEEGVRCYRPWQGWQLGLRDSQSFAALHIGPLALIWWYI